MPLADSLLRPHLLELLWAMHKLGGVCLRRDASLVRLLHEVLVALLVGEADRVFLRLEVQVRALHVVGRGLPAHQRVLPAVALGENVPVHAPAVRVPVARLSGGL